METVKVRMQTTIPPFARGTVAGTQAVIAKDGVGGYALGPFPLVVGLRVLTICGNADSTARSPRCGAVKSLTR